MGRAVGAQRGEVAQRVALEEVEELRWDHGGHRPKVNPTRLILWPMFAATRPPVPADKLRIGLILPTWTTTDVRWSEVFEIAGTAAEVGFDALDDISDGRLVLGLGAGDSEGEHLTFGFPHEQRLGRFEESLQVIKKLFNAESTDFDGVHHQLRGARLLPAGRRRGGPPILIGTLNPRPRMRRLVVEYAEVWNGWLGYTDAGPESAASQLGIIDDACREHGRDPNTLVATTAVRGAMPASGYVPRPDERPLAGPPREMAETLRGHARLGISEVQVALTMGGSEGVRAFAPVIEELRSR